MLQSKLSRRIEVPVTLGKLFPATILFLMFSFHIIFNDLDGPEESRAKRRRIHSAEMRIDVDKFLRALTENTDTNRLAEEVRSGLNFTVASDPSEEVFNVIVRVLNRNAQLSYMPKYFSALGFEDPRKNFNEQNRLDLAKLFATNVALKFKK